MDHHTFLKNAYTIPALKVTLDAAVIEYRRTAKKDELIDLLLANPAAIPRAQRFAMEPPLRLEDERSRSESGTVSRRSSRNDNSEMILRELRVMKDSLLTVQDQVSELQAAQASAPSKRTEQTDITPPQR
jgi:hypothetical protein